MQRYCPEFKRACVEKVLSSKHHNVDAIAAQNGVGRATLFRWVKLYGPEAAGVVKKRVRPKDWSMPSKLKALLEIQGMSDNEVGDFLRRKGLYFSQILQWKSEVLEEVKRRGKKTPDNEAALLRRVRELERELKLKDKALREATALAVLKKKAELLWGDNVEESSPEKSEAKPSLSSRKPKPTGRG